MGYQVEITKPGRYEFNWALKLKNIPQDISAGSVYAFEKNLDGIDERIYPNNLIDLINGSWEAVAVVRVLETNISDENGERKMRGRYKVEWIYDEHEARVMTECWRRKMASQNGKKAEEIEWSNFKST